MAERARWAFQLALTVSPKKLPVATWSRQARQIGDRTVRKLVSAADRKLGIQVKALSTRNPVPLGSLR
jgi:hypothetical protein